MSVLMDKVHIYKCARKHAAKKVDFNYTLDKIASVRQITFPEVLTLLKIEK